MKKRLKPFDAIIQKGQKVVDAKRTRKRRWEWNNPICWEKWPKNVEEKGCYLLRVILNKGQEKQLNYVNITSFFHIMLQSYFYSKKRRKNRLLKWKAMIYLHIFSKPNLGILPSSKFWWKPIKIYCLCYFFFTFVNKNIVKECQLDLFQILSRNINGNFLNRKKYFFPSSVTKA